MPDTSEQQTVFGEYARYYDLLYRDKDYAAEADYIARLVHEFHPGAKSILELGSGTGIHAGLLAEKGFSVHGIERSAEMLARSRSLAEKSATILKETQTRIRMDVWQTERPIKRHCGTPKLLSMSGSKPHNNWVEKSRNPKGNWLTLRVRPLRPQAN